MTGRITNSTLPRYTRLAHGEKGLQRSGPIRKKRRTPANYARIYHSEARVEWVKTLPCVAHGASCGGPIDNHHVKVDGMSRKAGFAFIVPACAVHHRLIHWWGVRTFEARFGVNLLERAAATQAAWEAQS